MKRCGKVILNNTDSQPTQWENEMGSLNPCTVASTSGINHWSQMQES
jgi:hypothetical protein